MDEEFLPFEKHYQKGQFASVAIPWEQLVGAGANPKKAILNAVARLERELKSIEYGDELFQRRERYLSGELKLKKEPSIDDYPVPRHVTGVQADVQGRETLVTVVAKGMRV